MKNTWILVLFTIVLLGFGALASTRVPANTQTVQTSSHHHQEGYTLASESTASRKDCLQRKMPEVFKDGYVDPQLVRSSGLTKVILMADNSLPIEEIGKHMVSCRATPSLGGFYLVIGIMKAENVVSVADIQGIMAIMKNRRIEYPVSTQMPDISTPLSFKDFFRDDSNLEHEALQRKPKTSLRDVVEIVGANQTWQTYGINGANTTIAVIDTGVDYGTFTLQESLAKDVENNTAAFNADATCLAFTNITVEAYDTPNGTFIPTGGMDPRIYFPEIPGATYRFSELVGNVWFADMNVTGIVDPGEECHFGLMYQWLYGPDLFPVLVVDEDGDGIYDTTYVDISFDRSWIPLQYYIAYNQVWPYWTAPWPPDFSFSDESPLNSQEASPAARDFTGDGIYDMSAGVLGYLVDVWNMAPNTHDRGLVLSPVDPYGNYTCFVNDWYGHGTRCASCAAGRERLHPLAGPGVAPGAKIMGVVALWMGDIIEGELWAAGFDLIPGTEGWEEVPNYGTVYGTWEYTGIHKADIISNSWGLSSWPTAFQGRPWYDILTIVEDALTVPGYIHPEYPGTVITHAGGNGAPGYGTITEPAYGSLIITVGASTSMHFSGTYDYAGGRHDEIIPWSARGPNPLGVVKPDIVSVGAYGFVPGPVWTGSGDGWNAFGIFGGTSMATPLVAGSAALVEQQHLLSYGVKPTPEHTRVVLKSTAKDLGHDSFVQGSGQVDCYAAVSLANKTAGVTVSTPSTWKNIRPRITHSWQIANHSLGHPLNWSPPSSPINDTSWFAGTIPSNESTTAQITVQNPTPDNITATVTPVSYEQIDATQVVSNVTRSMPLDWTPYTWGDIIPLSKGDIPQDADLMTVSMNFTYHHFDPDGDYVSDLSLWLYVADWNDTNADGVVNKNETYRINLGTCTGTTNEVRVGFPASKFNFTPIVYLWQTGVLDAIPYTIHIRFYTRTTWDWIAAPSSITLRTEATETFTAELIIPPETPQGIYEGQLMVNVTDPYSRVTAVPVSVSIPAVIPPDSLTYNVTPSSTMRLYDSYRVEGYFDWMWRYESGDWKTWLVNVTDPSTIAAFVTCNWTEARTDIDMFGINPHGVLVDDAASPYTYVGSLGSNFFQWQTRTGTTSEYLVLDTSIDGQPLLGIYTVLLHNVLFDGKKFPQELNGKVQLVKLIPRGSASHPINLTVRSGKLASVPLNLATGRKLSNLEVESWTSPIPILPTVKEEIEAGQSVELLNLTAAAEEGVYPATVNITSTEMSFPIVVNLNVTVDNTPPNASITQPETGTHLRNIYDVEVEGEDSHFDRMELYIDDTLLETWYASGRQTFGLNTSQISDGDYRIKLLVYDQAGNTGEASIRVTIDNTPPEASIISPSDGTCLKDICNLEVYSFDSHLEKAELYIDDTLLDNWTVSGVHTYVLNTENYTDDSHTIKVNATDQTGNHAQQSVTILIDNTPPTVNLTSPQDAYVTGTVNVTFTVRDDNLANATLLLDGKIMSDIAGNIYHVWNTTDVPDGEHTLTLQVIDQAGNSRTLERTVMVDNTSPTGEIRNPAEDTHIKGSCRVVIYGYDSNLEVIQLCINQSLTASWNVTGLHSYTWNTTNDGTPTIRLLIKDEAGNNFTDAVTVTVDNTEPSVSITSPEDETELSGEVNINFTITDTNLESAQLIVDHSTVFNVTGDTHSWNTTAVGDGQHTIQLVAYDMAGNMGEAWITVDTVNVKQHVEATRNLYLGIGMPIGAIIGAAIAYALLKRRL